MSQRTITIRAFEQGGEIMLYLIDSGGQRGVQSITTQANPGDEIIWKLDTRSNIIQIKSIYAKSVGPDVFKETPSRVSDSEFTAEIAADAQGIGGYNIEYEYKDTSIHVDDPFLEVDPPNKDKDKDKDKA